MTAVAVITIVSSALALVVVAVLFGWAARQDGRSQREHDEARKRGRAPPRQ